MSLWCSTLTAPCLPPAASLRIQELRKREFLQGLDAKKLFWFEKPEWLLKAYQWVARRWCTQRCPCHAGMSPAA
jgi:hypothetical protein